MLYKKGKVVKVNKIRLRKNDKVMVISGRDKGKDGKILKVLPSRNSVIIEKVNFVKRHMRARSVQEPGGIVEKEAPILIGKVALVCPKCSKPTHIKYSFIESGDKVRVCSKCNEMIDE